MFFIDEKGKRRVVARTSDGKLITWKVYKRKEKIRALRKNFNSNNTLNISLVRNKLKTRDYSEYIDSSLRKPKKQRPFLVVASVNVKRDTISASSRHMRWRNVGQAKDEARERLYQRVSAHIDADKYDAKTGLSYLLSKNLIKRIFYRLVYYA